MGDPKRAKKQYSRPLRPWDKTRLEEERELKDKYGLKNKRELWRVETLLRKKRKNARTLLALEPEEREHREQELLASLHKYAILGKNARLDDVLSLGTESFLERRLQTMVMRKGLANTAKQARQFIVHGHIGINGHKVSAPSYLVETEDEAQIRYFNKPLQLQQKGQGKKDLKKEFAEAAGIAPENAAASAATPTEENVQVTE